MTEEKLSPLFSLKEVLSEEEAGKMGRKDPEDEVEKFVSANTQELGKDKWLCPLSGKKFKVRAHKTNYLGLYNTLGCCDVIFQHPLAALLFTVSLLDSYCDASAFHIDYKGPEFVRKHILNKHGDKIEEVKKEVAFFNNFLMDAKRPSLPEMKLPPLPGPGQGQDKISISSTKIIIRKDFWKTEWINRSLCCMEAAWITESYEHCCPTGLLSPSMPFPPQGPQGPMSFGQPRPPLMGYGGMFSNCTVKPVCQPPPQKNSSGVNCSNSFSTGAPPYPPNQFGGGRGNYDNFRGQGGYLGKPRNIRWDHCTCDRFLS